MAEWVVYLGAVDRAFVPLVSVDVNASHRPDMLLVIAPLANPRPKFPAAGLSRAGGDHDDLGLGPNPTKDKSFWRCYQGLPGGRYRASTAILLGRSVVLGASADRRRMARFQGPHLILCWVL